MIVKQKIGNLNNFSLEGRGIDPVDFEWHEVGKRIQRKKTASGKEVILKFLNENPDLHDGDILFVDETVVVTVEILPADCMVIKTRDAHELASVCYEIGNKHLPLFYEDEILMVPFEAPLFKLLTALGYDVTREYRKLSGALRTTTSPHRHPGGKGFFDTIMQLTQTHS